MSKPSGSEPTTKGALAGVRVIDMTRVVAGPMATQTLGDLGADVIKIERPIEGDDARRVGPPWMRDADGNELDQSTYFQSVNRNKRSLSVDYARPEGADLLRRLAAQADVLIENYRPGTLARYGLGWDELKAINPRLVYCSVSGFGQAGPYASRSGYDYLVQAMAGVLSVTGIRDNEPGGGPLRVGIPLADTLTGLDAVIAILAALFHRTTSGRGQYIDLSLFEAQFAALLNPSSAWLNAGVEIGRTGNDHPSAAPYGIYPVDDGHILVATFNDREFVRLAGAVGRPDWADDARFAKNGARVRHREILKAELTEALKGRTKAEWVDALNRAVVSCGPINTIRDIEADPHVVAREMIVTLRHPNLGDIRSPSSPYRLSETPPTYRRAPPLVGEHTEEVLSEVLGLTVAEVAALKGAGIV
jgi:crotonobetainyl-CoA:carnitine CoA-transferase CaiB-like acyl-CoA transferase